MYPYSARPARALEQSLSLDIFNQPAPHSIVRGWLGPTFVSRLLDYVLANAAHLQETRVGSEEAGGVDHKVRRSQRLPDMGPFAGPIETELQRVLPEIFERLGTPPFTPTGYETELVAHGDGAFFSTHIDTYTTRKQQRVISGVYYFHHQPQAFSGGELRLYGLSKDVHAGPFVDIVPENDTLVTFPSWYPHEVLPVRCPSGRLEDSRFAVNCWILKG